MLAGTFQRAAEWMNDGMFAKVCCVYYVKSVNAPPAVMCCKAGCSMYNNTRKPKADIALFTPS